MRLAIRNQLLKEVTELKGCYEPNVPDKQTEKPYSVVVAKDDTDNGEVVGFKRSIEIWLYDERLSFKSLDKLAEQSIKALNLKVITNPKTGESFTCKFDGIIGQDIVDEEWNAIAKGLKFTIIALHEDTEENKDRWLDALSNYSKSIIDIPVYLNNWKSNFQVPSILWRVTNKDRVRETNRVIREEKTLICHVVSENKSEIEQILDTIEEHLITDLKIPYDIENRRYLTIKSITEDKEADMITKGQLTIELFKRKMIEDNTPKLKNIIGKGIIK